MPIPTEPIGSIPRPLELIEAFHTADSDAGRLDPRYDQAIRDTILRFEETGSVGCVSRQQLGSTDNCRLAPRNDDASIGRETTFAQIRARGLGTEPAWEKLRNC